MTADGVHDPKRPAALPRGKRDGTNDADSEEGGQAAKHTPTRLVTVTPK